MKIMPWLSLFVLLGSIPTIGSEESAALDPHLEPFRPFLGKTWKGHFKNSTPEKPVIDVSHWERALNGRAIRILHSVNDGVYGGETLIIWDAQKQQLTSFYFTTASYYTTGTMKIDGDKIVTHETVTGNANGITEVKSTTRLRAPGELHLQSEYLQNGQWVPGHEITYKEDSGAKVQFK